MQSKIFNLFFFAAISVKSLKSAEKNIKYIHVCEWICLGMFNDFVHLNNNNHDDDANRGSSSKPTEVVWEKGHENQTCGGETLAIISIVSASVVILFLLLRLLLPCSWIVWESPLCAFLISLFFFFTIELACLCSTLPCNYFFYMHLKNIVCAFHNFFFSAWSLTSINCFSLFFFFSCFLMPSFVSS